MKQSNVDVRRLHRAVSILALFHVSAGLKLNRRNVSSTKWRPDMNVSAVPAIPSPVPQDLVAGDLVYDFGFYNGADSAAYLNAGMRVVAVEADPSLVQIAKQDPFFISKIQAGQLSLLNYAIAPADQSELSWTHFYLNKCSKEWNSFYSGIGCRTCTPPHPEDPSACIVHNVMATPCSKVLSENGAPKYFKLDIEGAESGCYKALRALPEASRPLFISGEVGNGKLVDWLSELGYKSFKLVRQQVAHSGAFGQNTVDCRTGRFWRSVEGARAELQAIFQKGPAPGDLCPGVAVGGVWYDVHASKQQHQTW